MNLNGNLHIVCQLAEDIRHILLLHLPLALPSAHFLQVGDNNRLGPPPSDLDFYSDDLILTDLRLDSLKFNLIFYQETSKTYFGVLKGVLEPVEFVAIGQYLINLLTN